MPQLHALPKTPSNSHEQYVLYTFAQGTPNIRWRVLACFGSFCHPPLAVSSEKLPCFFGNASEKRCFFRRTSEELPNNTRRNSTILTPNFPEKQLAEKQKIHSWHCGLFR